MVFCQGTFEGEMRVDTYVDELGCRRFNVQCLSRGIILASKASVVQASSAPPQESSR